MFHIAELSVHEEDGLFAESVFAGREGEGFRPEASELYVQLEQATKVGRAIDIAISSLALPQLFPYIKN